MSASPGGRSVVVRATNANTPNRPRMIQADQRRKRALELRLQGLTFLAIAAELGVTKEAARKSVAAALEEAKAAIAGMAEDLRAVEAQRLEKITEVLWPRVLEGDLRAIDRVLRTRESFRRLTGLDIQAETPSGGTHVTVVTGLPGVVLNGQVIEGQEVAPVREIGG